MAAARRRHRKNYNNPGDAHELTFSCYRRFPMLRAERTCEWLRQSIEEARVKFDFAIWAYVFMPEHAHVIVWPRQAEYDIAAIRKAVKSPVGSNAMEYLEHYDPDFLARLTRRRGNAVERLFWQAGGGYDRNIVSSKMLISMIDYIHLNPVRRGLVNRPADWKWSSAAWFLTAGPSPLSLDPIPPEWLSMDDTGA